MVITSIFTLSNDTLFIYLYVTCINCLLRYASFSRNVLVSKAMSFSLSFSIAILRTLSFFSFSLSFACKAKAIGIAFVSISLSSSIRSTSFASYTSPSISADRWVRTRFVIILQAKDKGKERSSVSLEWPWIRTRRKRWPCFAGSFLRGMRTERAN